MRKYIIRELDKMDKKWTENLKEIKKYFFENLNKKQRKEEMNKIFLEKYRPNKGALTGLKQLNKFIKSRPSKA